MWDNYANEIREIVRKYKNKNDRQRAFKQIMNRLDNFLALKIRKVKAQEGEWPNINQNKLRNYQIMLGKHEEN